MHVEYTQGHSPINKHVLSKSGDLKLAEMGTELITDTLSDTRGFINVLLSLSDCTLVCRTLENLSIDEFMERNPERAVPFERWGVTLYTNTSKNNLYKGNNCAHTLAPAGP